MFVCEQCRRDRDWPEGSVMGMGRCQVCGQSPLPGYDIQNSRIPPPVPDTNDEQRLASVSARAVGNALFLDHVKLGTISSVGLRDNDQAQFLADSINSLLSIVRAEHAREIEDMRASDKRLIEAAVKRLADSRR